MPPGDLIKYVTARCKSDPGSLSSSLVLSADSDDGYYTRPQRDAEGNELPPLWTPTAIYGSDLVDSGDAVGALLGYGSGNYRPLCQLARQWQSAREKKKVLTARPAPAVNIVLPEPVFCQSQECWQVSLPDDGRPRVEFQTFHRPGHRLNGWKMLHVYGKTDAIVTA